MAQLNFNAGNHKPHLNVPDDISEQKRDTATRWSVYQRAVFDFVEHGRGNAVVEAVAGSGKSTTIVEALKRVRGASVFLAFNKSIADDLKAKGVNAKTFHSLCYSPVLRAVGVQNVCQDKIKRIIERNLRGEQVELYSAFVARLVGLARQVGIGCLVQDTEQAWIDICLHHNIEPEHEAADIGTGIELARGILDISNRTREVDFDDMLYLAVRNGITLPKFDFVFVDEAQDTNAIQRAILRKILRPGARLVAVGDPAQAIYGFRGADSESLNLISDEFHCVKLPLSISYRCPVSVVNYATQWVGHIQAAPGAKEGEVNNLGTKWQPSAFKENDLVVCRKTAPLISLAFKCVKARVPVQVMGRELGQGLKALIKRMGGRNVDGMLEKLEAWAERETEKARAKKDDALVEAISDKLAAIRCIAETLPEGKRTLAELESGIDYIFADKARAVKLATIHKAKGLEADVVWWLNRNEQPAMWARMDWEKVQEINLCYVAATRAKHTLNLIEEP